MRKKVEKKDRQKGNGINKRENKKLFNKQRKAFEFTEINETERQKGKSLEGNTQEI
jgi:hypothetical protein